MLLALWTQRPDGEFDVEARRDRLAEMTGIAPNKIATFTGELAAAGYVVKQALPGKVQRYRLISFTGNDTGGCPAEGHPLIGAPYPVEGDPLLGHPTPQRGTPERGTLPRRGAPPPVRDLLNTPDRKPKSAGGSNKDIDPSPRAPTRMGAPTRGVAPDTPAPPPANATWVEFFRNRDVPIATAANPKALAMYADWEALGVTHEDVIAAIAKAHETLDGKPPGSPVYYRNFVQEVVNDRTRPNDATRSNRRGHSPRTQRYLDARERAKRDLAAIAASGEMDDDVAG